MRTIGAIPASLPAVHAPRLEWESIGGLVEPALIVALLGSIDSLLTSLVADSRTRTRHNPNRELIGQGIGNLAAGVLGALPGAGATTGTVTSIRAGGRTPLAGVLAAILLLALLLKFGWIVEPIPLAVMAGILIKVGWDIIDWRFVLRLRAIRREYVLVMLLTFFVTDFVDLVTAVALGLIAAGVVHSKDLRREELDSVIAADIEDHDIVILDFSYTTDVDDSAALAIESLVQSGLDKNTEFIVSGLRGGVAKVLESLLVFRPLPAGQIVDSLDEAKRLSKRLLEANHPDGTRPLGEK